MRDPEDTINLLKSLALELEARIRDLKEDKIKLHEQNLALTLVLANAQDRLKNLEG